MIKKWLKRFAKVFGFLILSIALLVCWAFLNPANGIDALRVSKETTYITEPLRADGTVNYGAALNKQFSEGVTPENNVFVVIFECFGPKDIDAKYRKQYFQSLGINPLPEKGDYIIGLDDFAQSHPETPLTIQSVKSWRSVSEIDASDVELSLDIYPAGLDVFPLAVEWTESIDGHLDRIVEASHRERFFSPILSDGEQSYLSYTPFPYISNLRKTAKLLARRSGYRVSKGQTKDAWEDILAIYRLSRLTSQHPTLIGQLIGLSMDNIAFKALDRFLQSSQLTAAEIKQYRADFNNLTEFPSILNSINIAERYLFLDTVTFLAKTNYSNTGFLVFPANSKESLLYIPSTINWNIVTKRGNDWFDTIFEEYKGITFQAALALQDKRTLQFRQLSENCESTLTLAGSIFLSETRSNALADKLLLLLAPATTAVYNTRFSAQQRIDLADLAFAIAAYKLEQGSYPEKLKQLVPQYIDKIPKDSHTLKPLIYKRSEQGVLIYGVGRDQRDDGGLEPESDIVILESGDKAPKRFVPHFDDIAIRVGTFTPSQEEENTSQDDSGND